MRCSVGKSNILQELSKLLPVKFQFHNQMKKSQERLWSRCWQLCGIISRCAACAKRKTNKTLDTTREAAENKTQDMILLTCTASILAAQFPSLISRQVYRINSKYREQLK